MKNMMVAVVGAVVCCVQSLFADGQVPGDIYQESLSATIDNPQDWLVKESGVHRVPMAGDRMYIGTQAGNYLLQMLGSNCRLENLNEFAGVGAEQVTARVEIANGACLSVTNGFTLGAKEAGQKARGELLISGGKLVVKGVKFSGTNSDGKGNDSSVSVLIENGGELNLEAVTSSCIASLQLTGKEPVDFTVSTGGVLRANFASGTHYISAWKEANNPGQKYRDVGPGANVTFTVDGGLVSATNTSFYMQSSTIRMKSGSWCAKELCTTEAKTCGKLEMTGGDFTLSGDICLWNATSLADDFVLSGGTATVNRITCQSSVRVVKVSGGKLVLNGTVAFDNASGGFSAGRLWFHVYGSTADIAVPGVGAPRSNASNPISIPTAAFWDYRFDSTALPGGPGVAPCKKNLDNATVHGNYRISPYGGFQLVSTNVFPLVVHTSGSTLTTNTTYGTLLNTCHHTDLWNYALSGSTFAATLKEEAALVDGRTYAEGRVRGHLQLPRIGDPRRCLGATVRMNIVPQGKKTLDDIVSGIAGQYPGAVKIVGGNYNVEIPLPLERLGRGESNRVVFDFSDVTSFANAQNGVVATNALVTAIAAEVKKPGLILMLR